MILRQKGVPPKLADGLLHKRAGIVDKIRSTVTNSFVERSLGLVAVGACSSCFFLGRKNNKKEVLQCLAGVTRP